MELRPMTMADADKMLEWKNYPETRKFAIASHEEVKKEAHYKWLPNNLQYFQVIQFAVNESAGAIRVQDDEISIWVDKRFRKQGIATWVIEQVAEPGMIAKIVNGNIASMRAFIKARFLPISYHDTYTIFKR